METTFDFKKSIDQILYDTYDSKLLDNFTKKGNPKPQATIEKQKTKKEKIPKTKAVKTKKVEVEEKESEKSESEQEFSGSGSSSVEEIPLCEEDDESYEPVSVTPLEVPATRKSQRNV